MEKVGLEEVKGIVESEGLEYAITNYLSADRIEDDALRLLWEKAASSMQDVENYLRDNGAYPE